MTERWAEQCCFYALYSVGHMFGSWLRNQLIIVPEVFMVLLNASKFPSNFWNCYL